MARIYKRRKRLRYEGVAFLLFSFSFTIYLLSSLFINTINNNLTIQVQSKEAAIRTIMSENEQISVKIKELVNKDRVFAVAEKNNMTIEQSNVVAVR